jgi:hypothetical protein
MRIGPKSGSASSLDTIPAGQSKGRQLPKAMLEILNLIGGVELLALRTDVARYESLAQSSTTLPNGGQHIVKIGKAQAQLKQGHIRMCQVGR